MGPFLFQVGPPRLLPEDPSAARGVDVRRLDRGVFRACLAYTILSSLIWLYFVASQRDGGILFRQYNPGWDTIAAVFGTILFFWVGWSGGWYLLKRALLRRMGLSDGELDLVFSSRHSEFRLADILARHSERRIRILDMVGRRGRAAVMVLVAFVIMYLAIRESPDAEALVVGFQNNMLEAVVFGWWMILAYHSNGFLGKVTYGAQARIMDGRLARANCLLIGTLWGMFKFVMIPLGIQLGALFPPEHYAVLFLFIWVSYLVGDSASEVVGSLVGRQQLKVWGLGEVNRKSVEGTAACFAGALLVCLFGVFAHGLPAGWVGLALVIASSSTVVELWSPRGTDDFTMATTNAVWCWAFGVWYL